MHPKDLGGDDASNRPSGDGQTRDPNDINGGGGENQPIVSEGPTETPPSEKSKSGNAWKIVLIVILIIGFIAVIALIGAFFLMSQYSINYYINFVAINLKVILL